jgi:short-subunit dehydrogenase
MKIPDKQMKVAAITGAYGGLGAALSELLAKKVYILVLGGLNEKKLREFTDKIQKITTVEPVVMDVRKKESCNAFIAQAVKRFGKLDLLINNAGRWTRAAIEEVTEKEIRDIFETNIFGPIYLAQAAVKIMKQQRFGHILNVGSTSALDYKTAHIAYGSSKAALIGFTGCLRTELQGTGIRVTCFNPGGMKTNLFRDQPLPNLEEFMDPKFVAEKIVEHLESNSDEWNVVLRRAKRKR